MEVLTDLTGLAFILEQIIFNSTKYVAQNQDNRVLKFETVYDEAGDQTILHISDNGPDGSEEDLPFISTRALLEGEVLIQGKKRGWGSS